VIDNTEYKTANQFGKCRFLLPALQIQTVLDKTTISKRRKALSTMPTKLETAFASTITRIKNQKSERSTQALDVLKWTFLAQQPLSVIELCHALSVTIAPGKMQPRQLPLAYDETLDWDNFPSEKSVIEGCLSLVIIDEETSTVRLVHKSLHDYLTLLHENREIFLNGHSEIAYTCLPYMCFNDDKHEIDPSELEFSEHIKDLRLARFHLLDYATNSFGYHLHDQSPCTADMIHGLFPDKINLNCISTGCRSGFYLPFINSSNGTCVPNMNTFPQCKYTSACSLPSDMGWKISSTISLMHRAKALI
jgi:hypothetical protein